METQNIIAYFFLSSSKRVQIDNLYYLPAFIKDGMRKDDCIFHKSKSILKYTKNQWNQHNFYVDLS